VDYDVLRCDGPGWVWSIDGAVAHAHRSDIATLELLAVLTSAVSEPSAAAVRSLRRVLETRTSDEPLHAAVRCADRVLVVAVGEGNVRLHSTGGQVEVLVGSTAHAIRVLEHGWSVAAGATPPADATLGSRVGVVAGGGFVFRPSPGMAPVRHVSPPGLDEPLPVLGVLHLSDGQQIEIRRSVMVGRAPLPTSYDGRRECDVVLVDSPDHVVSRNHFEIAVVGTTLSVIDAGSHNGTTVRHPDGSVDQLNAGQTATFQHGDVILFADMHGRFGT
jgi:hypothetical protein